MAAMEGTAAVSGGADDVIEMGDGSANEAEDLKTLEKEAEVVAERVAEKVFGCVTVIAVCHLAEGGYNHVWVVARGEQPPDGKPAKFILRVGRGTDSLEPYQVRAEIACLQWLAANATRIPVPKLYDWDDGVSGSGPAFTAEEFIDGQRLSVIWPQLNEEQKSAVCEQIANVVADLGETRFSLIGSLSPSSNRRALSIGPTVEAAKVFNGRARMHSPECYDIGPYANSKDYILACYDREIYFYTHADKEDVEGFFENTSVSDFIDELKGRRQALAESSSNVFDQIDSEPRVLVHEDFHAGNMLVRDGKLVAVVDWEFSGVYPLSQLLGKAQILQVSMPLDDRTNLTEKEEDEWHERYRSMVEVIVRQRGWSETDIQTLMGDGHEILNVARTIMFPLSG